MITRGIVFLGVVLALLIHVPAHAQLSLTGLERPLTLSMTPEYPAPGETVHLSIRSFGVDLDRSTVTWYAGGTEIARGVGITSASVTAGALGSETVVEVIAQGANLVGSAQAIIRPTEVDLLWEPSSYAPPFYEGRILPGTNATIRAHALARLQRTTGARIPNTDIIYTWYKDGAKIASGLGRTTVTFAGPLLFGEEDVRVIAESLDGTLRGAAQARIAAVDPPVELYENHPLFGTLYHRALDRGALTTETEEKVVAVPYFAAIQTPRDAGLIYEWRVNGHDVPPDPEAPHGLLITTNDYTGPAEIELTLTSATDWFLRASGIWELVFEERGSTLFGIDPFSRNQN